MSRHRFTKKTELKLKDYVCTHVGPGIIVSMNYGEMPNSYVVDVDGSNYQAYGDEIQKISPQEYFKYRLIRQG